VAHFLKEDFPVIIDHVSLGTTRYADAVGFYQRVLAPLGLTLRRDTGAEAAFGNDAKWGFFLYPAPADEPVTGRGMHLAFSAGSRAAVRAVHEAALQAAGKDLFTPRERPDINDTYFGAMFLDLDGHRVEVVTHSD
jgi:catechol 2,3-dioxygenase-like lactoylglutathione lyase family enzyme